MHDGITREACERMASEMETQRTLLAQAVRLPELLNVYGIDVRKQEMFNTDRFFQMLALTWAGAARASELNDVAASVTAGHVNSSIASAKRILVGDLNLRTWLTIFQAKPFASSNHAHAHIDADYSNSRLSVAR